MLFGIKTFRVEDLESVKESNGPAPEEGLEVIPHGVVLLESFPGFGERVSGDENEEVVCGVVDKPDVLVFDLKPRHPEIGLELKLLPHVQVVVEKFLPKKSAGYWLLGRHWGSWLLVVLRGPRGRC